jgi:hypothetical protein
LVRVAISLIGLSWDCFNHPIPIFREQSKIKMLFFFIHIVEALNQMRSITGQLDFFGFCIEAEYLILYLFTPMQVFLLDLSVFMHAIQFAELHKAMTLVAYLPVLVFFVGH